MRKRLLSIVMAAAMLAGMFTATAAADPDPNGPAKKGMCTAYFNGSEKGREKKREAGPFQALEDAADDGDDETSPEEDVAAFCEGYVGGNPSFPS